METDPHLLDEINAHRREFRQRFAVNDYSFYVQNRSSLRTPELKEANMEIAALKFATMQAIGDGAKHFVRDNILAALREKLRRQRHAEAG